MIKIINQTNPEPIDAAYIYGDIKDDTLSGLFNGTPLDRALFSQYIQFFERMMAISGITANGLPDNLTNGFQLYEAFRKVSRPYNVYTALISQSGTNVPTAIVLENTTGVVNPTFTRSGVGIYNIVFPSAILTTNKTTPLVGPLTAVSRSSAASISSTTTAQIFTGSSGVLADSLLVKTLVEIKIYD